MKIIIDNNVVIDALRPNPEFETDAKKIFRMIGEEKITPYLCANSLTDIFYILKKVQGVKKAKESIANIMIAFNIVALDPADCADALSLPMNDFEDAIIAVCAQKISADFIVSRDEDFIKAKTAVKVITPGQLIKKI